MHRPSLRSVLTTVAAAAVLVGGADLTAYAATGNAFILGHSNSAGGTTSLKNTGRGPALSLNNIKSAPPLVVNSSKMVKHLNANMVGGKTATQLAGKTIRFHLGTVGSTLSGTQLFFAKVPKGTYQVSIAGILTDQGTDPTDNYTCLVADRAAVLAALGGGTLDLSKVYGVEAGTSGDSTFGFLGSINPAQKIANSNIVLGCGFNSTPGFTNSRQLSFTFRPVSVGDKNHGGSVLPRTTPQHLGSLLR